jgi:O-antigen/teichoic acid export membrane protein
MFSQVIRRLFATGYVFVVGGMVGRALLQMLLVILLARGLGRVDYGASVAIISVTGFFSTLAGLGASILHLKDAAIAPDAWQESLAAHHRNVWRSQPILLVLSAFVAWLVVSGNVPWFILLLLVAGDLLGLPHNDLMVRSRQGRGDYAWMAVTMCSLPALRVISLLGCLIALGHIDLLAWGIVCFSSGACMFFAVAWSASRATAIARSDIKRREIFAGLGFAMASASTRIHADADKAIIAKISSLGAAGDYSLAYRLMDVLLLPINSAIEWSIRNLFQHGSMGLEASVRRLWRRWVALLVFALMASAAAYLLAPLLPMVFGRQYENCIVMAHWLALLPLTTCTWMVVRSTAATAGHEKLVGVVELLGALLSVTLGVVLVMNDGWRGAVLATYLTHIVMTSIVLAYLVGRRAYSRQNLGSG